MSNSVFKVTEPNYNDGLTLVVSLDGSIHPDRDIVKSVLSSIATTDINLVTMKNVEANKVHFTLDGLKYIHTYDFEDTEEMEEIARNVMNVQLDHNYRSHTSATHTSSEMELSDDEDAIDTIEEQVSVQEFNDSLNNSGESMSIDVLEHLLSTEDIRAIIQSKSTKSFTSSFAVPTEGPTKEVGTKRSRPPK